MVQTHLVGVASCHSAAVTCHAVDMADHEVDQLLALLTWLRLSGRVASFSIQRSDGSIGREALHSKLRGEFGGMIVDACIGAEATPVETAPSFLMPVWPFDHEFEGLPASTAHFLGLDLTVVAAPADPEDAGCFIPGLPGTWFVTALPIC